jgi:hypothetical protein
LSRMSACMTSDTRRQAGTFESASGAIIPGVGRKQVMVQKYAHLSS